MGGWLSAVQLCSHPGSESCGTRRGEMGIVKQVCSAGKLLGCEEEEPRQNRPKRPSLAANLPGVNMAPESNT